ncbi:hypothetical protein [Streptomyces sp. 2231.1]|uniref:hypothetical protein n=1 Tax=Streptomyces sp. 2231.1 TaxID=1855347 RepID=UPI00115FF0DF|nr:hypothetical protein [Streptomyces sp. 2231.1]
MSAPLAPCALDNTTYVDASTWNDYVTVAGVSQRCETVDIGVGGRHAYIREDIVTVDVAHGSSYWPSWYSGRPMWIDYWIVGQRTYASGVSGVFDSDGKATLSSVITTPTTGAELDILASGLAHLPRPLLDHHRLLRARKILEAWRHLGALMAVSAGLAVLVNLVAVGASPPTPAGTARCFQRGCDQQLGVTSYWVADGGSPEHRFAPVFSAEFCLGVDCRGVLRRPSTSPRCRDGRCSVGIFAGRRLLVVVILPRWIQ